MQGHSHSQQAEAQASLLAPFQQVEAELADRLVCFLQLVDEFKQAARNAIDAGFDGVEIHGANVGGVVEW